MAYTTYPSEAASFSQKATSVSTKLTEIESGLKETEGIFKIDKNEDYLTLKTLESLEGLLNQVSSGKAVISTEVTLVTKKANQLEEEARIIAEAKKQAEEGASDE